MILFTMKTQMQEFAQGAKGDCLGLRSLQITVAVGRIKTPIAEIAEEQCYLHGYQRTGRYTMPSEELTTMPEKNQAIPFPGSLRDYFAGQALIGIIGKYPCEICEIKPGEYAPVNVSAAKGAYAYADALLAERERTGE